MKQVNKESLVNKVQKEMPEFTSEVVGLSVEQLNARLSQLSKDAMACEDAKEADEELSTALANASELGAPYRDVKKAIKLKSRFILSLITDKGGN